MSPLFLLALIATLFGALFVTGLIQGSPDPAPLLRARYVRLRRLGVEDGRDELEVRLSLTRQRFPGRSEVWCLRWLVEDLERAKR
jgi:hypothetical protein